MRLKNGIDVNIREIDEKDVNEYIRFKYQLACETERMMNKYPEEVDTDVENCIKKLTNDPEHPNPHTGLYAFYNNMIIGFVCFGPVEENIKSMHRAYYGIGILGEYTGLGLGRILSEIAFDEMRSRGFRQCELEVLEGNDRARSLYEKLGFISYGRRPNSVILKSGEIIANELMYKIL